MEPEDFEGEAEFATGGVVETRGGDRLEDYVPLFITPATHTSRFPEWDSEGTFPYLEDE